MTERAKTFMRELTNLSADVDDEIYKFQSHIEMLHELKGKISIEKEDIEAFDEEFEGRWDRHDINATNAIYNDLELSLDKLKF